MPTNGVLKDSTAKSEQHSLRRLRLFVASTPGLAIIYFCAITIAESTIVLIEPRIGLILHGCVLIAIFLHSALLARGNQQDFLLSLTLAPLVRLLSLSLPLTKFQFVYWYAIIGIPLLFAALLTARIIGLSRTQLGLTLKGLPIQLLFGLVGIGLGTIEYFILRPAPLTKGPSLKEIWLPAIILLIFTGLLEEIIFRSVMYYVSLRSLGRLGIFFVAGIFTVLHLGYKSITDVIFVFGVALLFGIFAFRTGSILGVTLAHGLTNIVLFLILPFAIGSTLLANSTPASKLLSQIDTFSTGYAYTQSSPAAIQTLESTPFPEIISPITTSLSTNTPNTSSAISPLQTNVSTPTITITPISSKTTQTPGKTAQFPAITLPPLTPTITFTLSSMNKVVVDAGDPEFLRSGGVEYTSQQGYGGDFVWSTTTDGIASVQVEWRPLLKVCGIYNVEVFIPSVINLTQFAFYQVGYRLGMTSRLIDQSAFPASWVSLGEYEFLPTSGTFLQLTNSTSETAKSDLAIIFDAARWTLVGGCKTNQP